MSWRCLRFDKHDQIILTNLFKTPQSLTLPSMSYCIPTGVPSVKVSEYNTEFYLTATFGAGSCAIYFSTVHIVVAGRQEHFS